MDRSGRLWTDLDRTRPIWTYWAARSFVRRKLFARQSLYYRIREGRLHTIRTIGGSQRVLLDSIQALLREDFHAFRDRGAGVSGRGPAARSPVS